MISLPPCVRDRLDWRWAIAASAAVVFLLGVWWHQVALTGVGAVVLCIMLGRFVPGGEAAWPLGRQRRGRRVTHPRADQTALTAARAPLSGTTDAAQAPPPVARATRQQRPPDSTDSLVESLLATCRYALLLRPETKQHLTELHVVRAIQQLDKAMALLPGGRVLLGQLAEQSSSAFGGAEVDRRLTTRNLASVEPVYLDRLCVTNEEYQQFVDAGGYEQAEFWHEEALPALLDFVDQTGAPGPRWWSDGEYPAGAGRLPVVGISWYEASAYARWVGKRLPTDAEWTKAGAWPVESSPGRIAQRRYPWGESFDTRRAALFGAGHPGPVAVDEYPGGVSVGGIHQLIGNVWEWTATPLAEVGDPTLHVSESVMSIRGGAFDTYFENQATCHYQSGEHPLARRPNIGFRLALPMSDLDEQSEELSPQFNADEPMEQDAAPQPAAVAT